MSADFIQEPPPAPAAADFIQGPTPATTAAAAVDDGPLPRWWAWAFAAAIVFAAGYWLWHQAFVLSPAPLDRYIAARAAALDTGFAATDADLVALARDPLAVRAGGQIFASRCVSCHGASAEGKVGPNLTDDFWIGGGDAPAIYQSIVDGRAARGMQAWGADLGPAACKQLTAFVLSLRGHPRPGKAAQGERWPAPPPP
jgi:cytochrome c oxidase cbb3-type subunit 3